MQFFILAGVLHGGWDTLYKLQQEASLSPGGIRPALGELENAGFLLRKEAGKRRQRKMELTAAGIEQLERTWQQTLLETVDSDLDSVVRAAWAAMQIRKDREAVADFLQGAARERHHRAGARLRDARAARVRHEGADTYQWMRALSQARQLKAEAEVLQELAAALAQEKDG